VAVESELALVEAAIEGNTGSFIELCQRYYPAMVAIAHSVLSDRHLAEDAAQEAFAKACLKLPELKKKDRFAWWIGAICRNIARDMARARKKMDRIKDYSMITANSQQEDELIEPVTEAIRGLSDCEREVIFLRYYEDLTYECISIVLGISKSAIDGRLRRAKKKIAGYLWRNGFMKV